MISALISALVGVTALIPIVGAFIGTVIGSFLILTVSLTGGVLGTTLDIVLATILGLSITQPNFPAFWLSASLMSFLAIISVIFYLRNSKKSRSSALHKP